MQSRINCNINDLFYLRVIFTFTSSHLRSVLWWCLCLHVSLFMSAKFSLEVVCESATNFAPMCNWITSSAARLISFIWSSNHLKGSANISLLIGLSFSIDPIKMKRSFVLGLSGRYGKLKYWRIFALFYHLWLTDEIDWMECKRMLYVNFSGKHHHRLYTKFTTYRVPVYICGQTTASMHLEKKSYTP